MKKQLWNNQWTVSGGEFRKEKVVDLPHDAMLEEPRVPGLKDGSSSGYFAGGKYTYTKTLTLTEEESAGHVVLEFEGIYMKSSVYLNGELVGGRIYGYSDFFVDLTGKVRAGDNEIKVIADNTQCANSRWYSGSGIYRDVYLHTAGEEYIQPDGIRVTTTSIHPAALRIQTDVAADAGTTVHISVLKGDEVVAEGTGADLTLEIPNAELWSAENPSLYTVKADLVKTGKIVDTESVKTGIRILAWNAREGLTVNCKTVNLRGGCIHHDNGFIGAAEFDAACVRRIKALKEAGFNAVRIAHHPASVNMLKVCDEAGMYVLNESFDTWYSLKTPYDYSMYFVSEWQKDLGDMIRISHNHPSVIMYSIGNEVTLKDAKHAAETTRAMVKFCHEKDATRPVTNAINPLMVIMGDAKNPEQFRDSVVNPRETGKPSGLTGSLLANVLISALPTLTEFFGSEKKMKKINDVMEPLDIVGYNYADYLYDPQHQDFPDRVLLGTETFPSHIGENWKKITSKPWVVGDFMWTAWDYLGEAGVGTVGYGKAESFTQPYPAVAAGCASVDLTGEINCQGHYSKIVFGQDSNPYIAVHPAEHAGEKTFLGRWRMTDALHSWTWRPFYGITLDVDVYSNASSVELILNGKSFGKQAPVDCIASFKVPYEEGELKAVNYDASGKVIGADELKSAGKEAVLKLEPEKGQLQSGRQDLLYVPIEITDNDGVRQIRMDRDVTVAVDGPAELIGIGSASLTQNSLTPYIGDTIHTFEGRALAVIRSGNEKGSVTITVSSKGMEPQKVEVPVV